MPNNTNTVKITLQFTDDGTIKIIDQAKGKTAEIEKATVEAGSKGSTALAKLKSHWVDLAAVAGGAAGYGIVRGLKAFVDIAAEAEKIESRMAFQIEATGIKYEKIKKQIDSYANSIMLTTRFSHEAAREGLGKMMQYTDDLTKALGNTKLAMDMSTQTGMDFDSTIRLIGMAMNGNVEMLGRWIPELRDLDSKLGESTSRGEKAAYAFKILNERFSGASAKDMETYAGRLERIKNVLGEIKERIGEKVIDMLTKPHVMKGPQWIFESKPIIRTIEEIVVSEEKLDKAQKDLAMGLDRIAEASKAAQSLKYTLGMKGVAEEAAEFRKDLKTMFQSTEALDDAFKTLSVTSQRSMATTADWTLKALTTVRDNFNKSKVSVIDYVNALKAADDILKKMTGEDISQKRTEAWDKNAETIKRISKDEEGWLKKVDKANDDLFKTLKDLEKLKIPTHADVGPMEREVQESIKKLEAQGITIPVSTQSTGGGVGAETITWLGKPIGMSGALMDLTEIENKLKGISDINVDIGIYGTGSSRKPITEKIHEIISEFGGLEKALSDMEAEINLAELTAEYSKLQKQLDKEKRFLTEISNFPSGTLNWNATYAAIGPTYQALFEDLTSQMKILQMKMDYQMLKAYGGSYQTGSRYVPQTGLYMLHEGEQVTPRNVSSSITVNNYISGVNDPREIGDKLTKILKYRLNQELGDFLKR